MNCCVLRLPSKPSGECVDELYVIPSTVYNVWMELTKYPRASPCKNFPDNECCKSPDDSPSDYPIIGPSGPGVIFDQPQQNRSPEAFQDGKPYNRGWEGSNNNVGSNVPNFFTCSSLKRSLGFMLTKVTKSSGLEIYCCSIMFGVHHGFATMMNIFQRTVLGETKFRPGANLPPAYHYPKCLLALQVSNAPACKPAEVSDIRN